MEAINRLMTEIRARQTTPKVGSYTNYLFDKGEDKILKKIGEEATEVVIAAKNDDKAEILLEVADLTYHVLVLLAEKNISLAELATELESREGKLSKTTDRKAIDTL
ncbi:phosphoribosyl-ATP diphosphatase [Brochothrix campestris]|uniref:Phosphoribosyl-ATP pyrophosphatase n=1 Tax=Brochothrix campestris FSL F6-1037 TaxID=1265861 RepID=W7CVQ9_9LIST|nr:phosphoribosyl-ATP diphosphatase [Brochothrix campestris]EUJ37008.1 phosphoribosyl-ATP pyrophosphatase [Brochothrix campestris FSL F6-1037]